MTKLGDTAARFLWTPLCVCMVLACGKQALQGGSLLEPDGGGSADAPATGNDSPVTGGASGGGGGATGGGSGATLPSSGGAEGPSCSNAIPCGGDMVGTWTVTSSCLQVSGQLDMAMVGLSCTSAPVTGSLQVTGTWIANSDGTFRDNTSTQGEEMITLPSSCQEISGTIVSCEALSSVFLGLGYEAVKCTSAASGGCTCLANVQQSGGMGLVSFDSSRSGKYGTSGNVLTLNSAARYSYCVSANQMSLTLLGTGPITTGTIALQRGSTAGSGGSSGSGGASETGGSSGGGGSTGSTLRPCDIYASEAGPCVAAHSTVRALLAAYNGPLYQVRRADDATKDIPLQSPGGFADTAVQDAFCDASICTISVIYDQSGMGNHLTKAPPGGAKATPGKEADATGNTATFSGHKVHGLYLVPGVGYRNNQAIGTATGDDPETIYMVVSGQHYNAGCCFDYGNAETNNFDNGEGAVEAVYFGSCNIWGQGAGSGPWVMGDLENGLWPGSEMRSESNPSVTYDYVTAMVKGGPAGANRWAIKVGDAQSGSLAAVFDGPRPSARYQPMRKEGAIILGIGGDNSNAGQGIFFEGIMTAHFSSDAADNAVQASIVSVYGR